MNAKTLREKRANVWIQMQALMDTADAEGRGLSGEELKTYEGWEGELDTLTRSIEKAEEHEARAKEFNAAPTNDGGAPTSRQKPSDESGEDRYAKAFRSFLRGTPVGDMRPEYSQALRSGYGDIDYASSPDPEVRAQGTGTTAGGYLVPAAFRNDLVRTMKWFGPMMDVAQTLNTAGGQTLPWPSVDDTGNVGALLAENTQMSEQDITLGVNQLASYVFTSKLTRLSYQLLQDSAIDPEALVVSAHGERIGRVLNTYFTTGTGTSQPKGIITGAVTGKTAASTTTFTADELIDLVHSVDPAYRNERCRFMFADSSLAVIRKLKDSQNRYLWEPSMQAGVAGTIFGYGYLVNNDFPALATGVTAALFGDYQSAYVIRLVTDVRTITFSERFADFLQVAHASYQRADGTVQNTNAYKALKLA
jgi:HK97 family phage major capsid protein